MADVGDSSRAEILMYDEFEEFGVLQNDEVALDEALLTKDNWDESWNREPVDSYINMLRELK